MLTKAQNISLIICFVLLLRNKLLLCDDDVISRDDQWRDDDFIHIRHILKTLRNNFSILFTT